MKTLGKICADSFYEMENYHQISIDLIQEAEELFDNVTNEELLQRMQSLGALYYTIDTVLEVFNPVYEIEISDLKDVLVHIENRIQELRAEYITE